MPPVRGQTVFAFELAERKMCRECDLAVDGYSVILAELSEAATFVFWSIQGENGDEIGASIGKWKISGWETPDSFNVRYACLIVQISLAQTFRW